MAKIGVPGLKESDGEVFPVINQGQYHCRITSVDDSKELGPDSKYPGAQAILFKAQVHTPGEAEHGFTLLWNQTIPNKDMEDSYKSREVAKIKRLCIACGIDSDSDDFDTDDLMHAEFTAVVVVETKDGVKRNVIKDWLKVKE